MVTAILLAAGQGSRLGTPKVSAELMGQPFVTLCTEALLGGGIQSVHLVIGPHAELPPLPEEVAIVINPHPETGQTGSLQAGLRKKIDADGFAIHTVDRPLVTSRDVSTLLQSFRALDPAELGVIPSTGGRAGHPAFLRAGLADEIVRLSPDVPAHSVFRKHRAQLRYLDMNNPWLVRDINTPEDLADAEKSLAGGN